MLTSTEIGSVVGICGGSREKAVELVARAGFDAWDFSMFDMASFDWGKGRLRKTGSAMEERKTAIAMARTLKKIGEDNGIFCNQSHAPFPVSCAPIREYLPLAIECTAEAGGTICIIHPDNNMTPEENAEMYRELLPLAKSCGVKIATENMWNWDTPAGHAAPAACSDGDNFCRHIDVINDPFFVACLDLGHAEMMGETVSAAGMVRALGPRLQALHIHDNDRIHDNHEIPGTMKIDFDAIVRALAEIGYSGVFTMEAGTGVARMGADPEKSVGELYRSCRELADKFERYAKETKKA